MQTDAIYTTLSGRSRLIAAYSLCGFGNLGALGTQIGLLSQMAPERSGDISRVAWSAWITGIISTLMSASMAGMLITDQRALFSSPVGGLNNTLAGNSTLLNSLMIG
jgi:CNT family concentrative nucleoside transporter